MKQILYYNLEPDASSYYRTGGTLPYISNPDLHFTDISHIQHFAWHVFLKCDVFIMQRPFRDIDISIVKLAKDQGCRVILDYDDNLFKIPSYNPAFSAYKDKKDNVRTLLRLADEVWVSTAALADEYREHNTNVHIIPNAHNDYMFPLSEKRRYNRKSRVAAYRGGATHRIDIFSVCYELASVIQGNPDWEFQFMGSEEFHELSMLTKNVKNHTFTNAMSLLQYMNYLHTLNPGVAFFPLADNVFNQSKSNISWLEFTYAGAAYFGNKELPEFNKDCILPFGELGERIGSDLSGFNHASWELIQEQYLLSITNNVREERILCH